MWNIIRVPEHDVLCASQPISIVCEKLTTWISDLSGYHWKTDKFIFPMATMYAQFIMCYGYLNIGIV